MITDRKSLLGIRELEPEEILQILDTAESFKEVQARSIKKVPALRGVTVVNLFFENSTRTRSSFELAEKRQEIPPQTLLEAAQLAAFHSQGRPATAVDVSWTWKRHVMKRKGAPTGQVTLRKFQTIRVRPEESLPRKDSPGPPPA